MDDNIGTVATHIAAELGKFVENDQINPGEVAIGGLRGAVVFFMACAQEGKRTEAIEVMRQAVNEEFDNLVRGIANGMVPA
jgi:hypothetical protein